MFYVCISTSLIKIGGTYTKPLLLPPEVAIGGFGKIQVCIWIICDQACENQSYPLLKLEFNSECNFIAREHLIHNISNPVYSYNAYHVYIVFAGLVTYYR